MQEVKGVFRSCFKTGSKQHQSSTPRQSQWKGTKHSEANQSRNGQDFKLLLFPGPAQPAPVSRHWAHPTHKQSKLDLRRALPFHTPFTLRAG